MSIYKVVLVGKGGVGKSCLTIQFISNRFVEDYDPTLEDSYRKEIRVDGNDILLDIFDTAGQEDFSSVRDQYMRTGDGFLCVYSITYPASFEDVELLHRHVLRVKDVAKVPFVLLANKCDLESSRQVTKDQGMEIAEKLGCKFFETSAKTNTNITEAFHQIVRDIYAYKKDNKSDKDPKRRKPPCVLL